MQLKYFFLFIALNSLSFFTAAQCVLINEVMVNPSGPGDCNGGEWIELYNTCSTPFDISCFVLADGDFTIRFPTGTSIPPNGYFVVGTSSSGGPVDLNIVT
ncbi:MAG: lamin tail domain-containing protein, partial [Pseudomonadota bacterium]